MNSIITLPKLVELLKAVLPDVDPKLCEDFVPAFTTLVAETLKHDDFVKIKGLGTFHKEVTPEKTKVTFVPDKEIADSINAPFVFFAPEELSDGVQLSDLETPPPAAPAPEAATVSEVETEPTEEPAPESEVESEPTEEPVPEPEVEAVPVSEEETADEAMAPAVEAAPEVEEYTAPADDEASAPAEKEPSPSHDIVEGETANDEPEVENKPSAPNPEYPVVRAEVKKTVEAIYPEPQPNLNIAPYEDEPEEKKESMPWFLIALFYVVGMLVGFGLGFFGHDYISGYTSAISTGPEEEDLNLLYDDEVADSIDVAVPDTVAPEPAAPATAAPTKVEPAPAAEPVKPETPKTDAPTPSAQEVYVTVSPGSGLFDIAKKQYGHKEYWVYIYMENTDKIKNPNNVSVGMKLRIPPKEKYDVSKTDEAANLKAAKAKGGEVLNKFRK